MPRKKRKVNKTKKKSVVKRDIFPAVNVNTLFDFAPDAYFIYDLDGIIRNVNNVMCDITGYKQNELIGVSLLKMEQLLPTGISKFAEILQNSAYGNSTGPTQVLLNVKNGKSITVEINTYPLPKESIVLAIARDVTEKNREVEDIKGLASFTIENPQPSMRIGRNGTLLYANASSTPLRIYWNIAIGGIVPKEWREIVSSVLDSGIRENVECELDGQVFSFVIVPVANSYVNLYGRNITYYRKAQDRLQSAYTELKDTQTKLIQAEKMNVVGGLASGIAHEVKNPLAIILQGIDFLYSHIEAGDRNVVATLDCMKDAVERADGIIKELLDFSSLATMEMKAENINSVLEESLSLVKHQLDKFHVKVTRNFSKEIPQIAMDKNRLEQVFVNLFMNSINAMPNGGELTIQTVSETKDSKPIKSIYDHEEVFEIGDSRIIVSIEDTGSGIPPDVLDKIFDPFFTTRRAKGGTGLGLSIVRNIIDAHNGRIDIRNKKDTGVISTLTFEA